MIEEKFKTNISELLKNPKNGKYLKVVARKVDFNLSKILEINGQILILAMVRYSRLEFRSLTRRYGADLTFSPMIIANSFCQSEKCRRAEFTTNHEDTPLIVQFAASDAVDLQHGTEMVYKYCDGVDVNCGCPQRWVMQDGYGSFLLTKPEKIEDMIKTIKRNYPSELSISIKIRLLNKNLADTIDFCRKIESLDPTFITIHGRTPKENSSTEFPVDTNAIAEIKKSLYIPVIFNGDVSSLKMANDFYEKTKCNGMMSARGVLKNPALFDGHDETPLSCVQDWIDIHEQQQEKMTFQNFHHHLSFMTESLVSRADRIRFNDLTKKHQCLEFVKEMFSIVPKTINYPQNINCTYDDLPYKTLINHKDTWNEEGGYSTEKSHGKFFLEKQQETLKKVEDDEDYLDDMNALFIE